MKSIENSLSHCIQEIQSRQEEDGSFTVSARCSFPQSFSGFSGHFPGNPILPAIVQLAAVRHIVESSLKKNLFPIGFSRTKFRSMVKPEQEISIALTIKNRDEFFEGKFSLRSAEDQQIADGHYRFTENL